MWYLILGMIIGIVVACIGFLRLVIGELRFQQDDGETYFYMQLSSMNVYKIPSKKYVVLKVNPEVKRSLK